MYLKKELSESSFYHKKEMLGNIIKSLCFLANKDLHA